jgi:hypothetical protein
MLDIVAPHDDELALLVEIVEIDDAQTRLPVAPAAGRPQTTAEHQSKQRQHDQRENQQRQNGGDKNAQTALENAVQGTHGLGAFRLIPPNRPDFTMVDREIARQVNFWLIHPCEVWAGRRCIASNAPASCRILQPGRDPPLGDQ